MSNKIEDLEPITMMMCTEFLAECESLAFPKVRLTHTLRTMDEQAELWQKGREFRNGEWVVVAPKQVVTKARPGKSPHNYGAAFDICFSGHDPYPEDEQLWEAVGLVGESCGLEWGGRWTGFVDRPHFQRRDWKVLRDGASA